MCWGLGNESRWWYHWNAATFSSLFSPTNLTYSHAPKHIDFDSPAWTHCLVATSVFISMSFYKSQWRYFGFFIPLSIIHIENESIHWRISNVSLFFLLFLSLTFPPCTHFGCFFHLAFSWSHKSEAYKKGHIAEHEIRKKNINEYICRTCLSCLSNYYLSFVLNNNRTWTERQSLRRGREHVGISFHFHLANFQKKRQIAPEKPCER